MKEVIEGNGTLRWTEHPPAQWSVAYRFVTRTNLATRLGFPPAIEKIDTQGTVTATNNVVLAEGYYELIAEDGEILRVKNLGLGAWAILAPIA